MAVIAYYRVSTAYQTIENQRLEINKTYKVEEESFDEAVSGCVVLENLANTAYC